MNYFPTAYQSMIYKTRYSRWLKEENRREEWPETVGRYTNFMFDRAEEKYGFTDEKLKQEVQDGIKNLEVMPSMRALMTAGPALDRSNIAGYNCSFLAIDEEIAFDEALYILMNGTGVGFSVESKYTSKLPVVPTELKSPRDMHEVDDSKEGWAYALRYVVTELYAGYIPDWSTFYVRKEGARLETFGGRASGPKPLNELLNFVVNMFVAARGRKLTPLECHELMCKVGEVVVVGGVRRSALISLSDLDDIELRDAKSGNWWEEKGHLSLANNSVAYQSRPDWDTFQTEWKALEASGSGERGIFNMEAARLKAAENGRDDSLIAGTNPCGEIILRNKGFCNLSSITVGAEDTEEDLKRKIRLATAIGTLQSSLTDFPYLSDKWKRNAEEERLLGVSLNGVFNNPLMYELGPELDARLVRLKEYVVECNVEFAAALGINASASATCIKPEGTVSQLVNSASGIHPWHSEYYVRRVRGDKKDPVTEFLEFYGTETEDDVMRPASTAVFSFPIKAPERAVTRDQLTAIEHLETWLTYSENWSQHNPSVTINVKPSEWDEVGKWVYDHFDRITGVSFLPYSDHTYQQAPYEEIEVDTYLDLKLETPSSLPWEALSAFEVNDTTTGDQALSCMAGGCELVSI